MNILDAVIIIILLVGALSGFRRGVITEAVLLVGLVFVSILAFYIRVPVSTYMYSNFPFFGLKGIFSGISAINILIYELIAFLLVFSVLYIILRIVLKITGVIEKVLDATIILGIVSKIGGVILGVLESYICIFIILFIGTQPLFNVRGMEDSKLAPIVLKSTPIMTKATSKLSKVTEEIYSLAEEYKGNKESFNDEAVDLFLKYDIITQENVDLLKAKGKL